MSHRPHRAPGLPRILASVLSALSALTLSALTLGTAPALAPTRAPASAPPAHAPALAPALAPAADNGTWAVFPAPAVGGNSGSPDRQYFYLEAAPGAVVKDSVSLYNLSAQPISFRLYGADAYNTPRDGGFALRAADQPQTGVGAWVHLKTGQLTVPPHTRANVPFTVDIPAGAEPGDHPGAVVALDTATEPAGPGGKVAVGIQRAVGARLYLRVSGVAVPDLSVGAVQVDRHPPLVPGIGGSTATIHYTLVNHGNVTVHPKLSIKGSGWLGGTLLDVRARDLGIDLLPGQQVRLSVPWPDAPQFDRVSVKLSISGTDIAASGSSSFLAVPWLPVGVLLLIVAALLLLWVRAKRRHTQPGRWAGLRLPRPRLPAKWRTRAEAGA